MSTATLQESERAIVLEIKGPDQLKSFLLCNGITVGTVFSMNYSPNFTALINLTIGAKMVSLRKQDFVAIDWVRI